MERTLYENLTLDQERALYGARGGAGAAVPL